MVVNAPAFRVNSWQIDDTFSGNGNSRLDPGETVDVIIATENYGNALSSPVTVELSCLDAEITVNTSAQELETFEPAELENVVFSLTVDSEAAIGALVELHYSLTAGILRKLFRSGWLQMISKPVISAVLTGSLVEIPTGSLLPLLLTKEVTAHNPAIYPIVRLPHYSWKPM